MEDNNPSTMTDMFGRKLAIGDTIVIIDSHNSAKIGIIVGFSTTMLQYVDELTKRGGNNTVRIQSKLPQNCIKYSQELSLLESVEKPYIVSDYQIAMKHAEEVIAKNEGKTTRAKKGNLEI